MRLTAVDLFSGAGGMALGLHQADYDVRIGIDSWQLAVDSYTKNFPNAGARADLALLEATAILDMAGLGADQLDLLVGGPPCQGFSLQRIGVDLDPRNELVLRYARLISDLRPRAFLMENVPGLLGHRGRAIAAEFVKIAELSGYVTSIHRVDAADYGVPQRRNRAIFVGLRDSMVQFVPPAISVSGPQTVWDAIGDLPKPAPAGTTNSADPLHIDSKLSPLNRHRIAMIPPGGGFEDLPPELRVNAHRNGAAKIGHRGVYGRLRPDAPAGTITARFDSFTRGRFGHPAEARNITLREGARLQTFPDWFQFLGNREEVAAQIGNAVPPELARVFGLALKDYLR